MIITAQTIITLGATVAAIISVFALIFKAHRWYLAQNEQDKKITELKELHKADINRVKEENTLICYALSACLDGLQQLGANHTVPIARDKLDKYLNQQAHNWRG